jgi:hypothetical protein
MVLRFCTLPVRLNVQARHKIALCYLFKKTASMGFMNAREKVIIIKQLVDTWTMDQLIKAETTDEERLDQLLSLIVKK